VFVKLATIAPTSSAFYRCAIGAILLAACFWGRGRELWARGRGMWMLALAALFFALDLVAWHRSIVFVGPGLATLLANFQAFVLALAACSCSARRCAGGRCSRYRSPLSGSA
jgi:drug/metabolite transporter (DMT)-like permease